MATECSYAWHVTLIIHLSLTLPSRWGRETGLLCFVCLPGARDFCVAVPHAATSLSAVCDCGILPIILTYYL